MRSSILLLVTALAACAGCHHGRHHAAHHAPHCHPVPGCPSGPHGQCELVGCEVPYHGHPNPCEPLWAGHHGPPERGGVLGKLCAPAPAVPAAAQPAPPPSAAAVSYPYYTNRGPRDFLANRPLGIGP